MFQIASQTQNTRTVQFSFATYAEAEAFAKSHYDILDFIKDDFEGYDCADFVTTGGLEFQIEPSEDLCVEPEGEWDLPILEWTDAEQAAFSAQFD